MADRLGSAVLVVGGAYLIGRTFLGKEFFLVGIGGRKSNKALPNWLARPLMFLIGLGAVAAGVGVWLR